MLRAAKVMSTWQHASLLRLQPHYVYILGSSKSAVTTALQAHSPRQRLIGVKKDCSTPSPLPPCLPRCHSPGVVPLFKQKRNLFFSYSVWPYLTKGAVTTASASLKGRGYTRASATFCLCVAVLCVHSPFGSRRSYSYPARWQQLVISALTSCMV